MSNKLDAKIKQKRLVNESDFNEKIKTLATKEELKILATNVELKAEKYKIITLQISDFIGQSYFNNDASQNYLIFQPIYKLLQHFLVLPTKSQNGNLRDCQMKTLSLFILQIKAFLQSWHG